MGFAGWSQLSGLGLESTCDYSFIFIFIQRVLWVALIDAPVAVKYLFPNVKIKFIVIISFILTLSKYEIS